MQEWFALSDAAKVVLIIEMWAGRLEIFPALALIISFISLGARRREAPGAQD
jgi:Trk-type K+ transport system membrane component